MFTPCSLTLTAVVLLAAPASGAGDVSVSHVDGHIQITGDGASNVVYVQPQLDGSIGVAGLEGTLINGGETPLSVDSVTSIGADLGAGDDRLVVDNITLEQVEVAGRRGNDFVQLVTVELAGDAMFDMGGGQDRVDLVNCDVTGGFLADLGRSDDMIFMAATTLAGDLRALGGDGADVLLLIDVTVGDDLRVGLGAGDDTVDFSSECAIADRTHINAGVGNDTLIDDGSTVFAVEPDLQGFESGV